MFESDSPEHDFYNFFKSGFENTENAVMLTSYSPLDEPGPAILYTNSIFSKMTGYAAAEVVGRSPRFNQGDETDSAERSRIRQALSEDRAVSSELINYRKDGSPYWTDISIAPCINLDKKAWLCIKRDVTEKKQRELDLVSQNLKLQSSVVSARKLISLIAHDLRSPMTGITGCLKYLAEYRDELGEKEYESYIDSLSASSDSVQLLLENLLEWAVQQGEDMEPEKCVCYMHLIVDDVIVLYALSASTKSITIENNIAHDFVLNADSRFTHAVIRNIISNSIKNTLYGGNISVSAGIQNGSPVITVSDSSGTALKFEGDFLLDQTTLDAIRGKGKDRRVGLGLAMCMELMEKQGGSIYIGMNENGGTTVKLVFA